MCLSHGHRGYWFMGGQWRDILEGWRVANSQSASICHASRDWPPMQHLAGLLGDGRIEAVGATCADFGLLIVLQVDLTLSVLTIGDCISSSGW